MRDLSGTQLTQAQKDMGDVLCKLVIGGVTYGVDTTNRLLKVQHTEQPYSQTANVLIENADKNLSALALEGLTGVLSYGYHTLIGGDEYSATAPLRVKAQESYSAGGTLVCQLVLFGIPDQMNDDKASIPYEPTSDDTMTVKDLIDAIAGDTTRGITMLACYSHCPVFTVDWGTEDSLIDVYMPKDSFRIGVGQTRLAKIKELLDYTKCVMRVQYDGHLHIWSPTVYPSTDYIYIYNDTIDSANHTFFSKIYRTRIVIPGKIVVRNVAVPSSDPSVVDTGGAYSLPEVEDEFTIIGVAATDVATLTITTGTVSVTMSGDGTYTAETGIIAFAAIGETAIVAATDPSTGSWARTTGVPTAAISNDAIPYYEGSYTSADALVLPGGKIFGVDYRILNVTSNAQATAIATAMIQRAELDHERGSGLAPMNVGQEVYDLVNITDTRENDSRAGNIGWLTRNYEPGKFDFQFGFGNILLGAGIGLAGITSEQPFVTYAEFANQINTIYTNLENLTTLIEALTSIIEQMMESVPRWTVTERLRIPVV